MMSTQSDTHTIDATEEQVAYLNRLAEISAHYRNNLRYLKKWTQEALDTPNVTAIDHQTFNKVQQWNGAVGELLQMKHFIFPSSDLPKVTGEGTEKMKSEMALDARRKEINDWIKLAREENPNGMLGINWFVAAK
jgi:hypothetical protein